MPARPPRGQLRLHLLAGHSLHVSLLASTLKIISNLRYNQFLELWFCVLLLPLKGEGYCGEQPSHQGQMTAAPQYQGWPNLGREVSWGLGKLTL
jgi:hypothetical protein